MHPLRSLHHDFLSPLHVGHLHSEKTPMSFDGGYEILHDLEHSPHDTIETSNASFFVGVPIRCPQSQR